MKIIHNERQTGKTTELIKMCSRDRYSLIVAPNRLMCNAILKQSIELGYDIPNPITFKEFIEGKYCKAHIEKFYIDELESCLQSVLGNVTIDTVVIQKK